MKFWKLVLATAALVLSGIANAVTINTLNDVSYEWLELTETQGLSRDQVDVMLLDPNSSLFGYHYASRSLVEDLFRSYTPWTEQSGWFGDSDVIASSRQLMTDFGQTHSGYYASTTTTVDGFTVDHFASENFVGFYGESDECGVGRSCVAYNFIYQDAAGNDAMVLLDSQRGWDANSPDPILIVSFEAYESTGSFLVRTVPIPGAVWLFGTGLVGLFGLFRRSKLSQ